MKWTKQCGTTLQPRGWGLKYLLHLPHLASSIDLKRMQTLHSLSRDIAADKTSITSYRGGRRQNCGLGHPPVVKLAITPEGYSRRQGRFWVQNQSRSLGAELWHSFGVYSVHSVGQTSLSTNKGRFQVGRGRNQLARKKHIPTGWLGLIGDQSCEYVRCAWNWGKICDLEKTAEWKWVLQKKVDHLVGGDTG